MAEVTIINSAFPSERSYFPVGPLIVASTLELAGYQVDFRDYQIAHRPRFASPDTFAEYMAECSSPVLGITTFANTLPTVLLGVSLLKDRDPRVKIVLGGPGVSGISRTLLELSPVDVVVRGEGENVVSRVVEALLSDNDLSDIGGITYRRAGRIIENPDLPLLKDLDRVPLPTYSKLRLTDYGNKVGIVTSRGCPYHCTFCAKPIWNHGVSFRTIANVISEIRVLSGLTRRIHIYDDSFISSKQRVADFCCSLQDEDFGVEWDCTGRVGLMDDQLMALMARSGCKEIFFGIESGSDQVLERIRKGFTVEEARNVLNQAAKWFTRVHVSFIWGFPFETYDDFQQTLFLIMGEFSEPPFEPVITLATPFVSSPLYKCFGDRIRYLPGNCYNGSTLGKGETLESYPELLKLVIKYPDLFPSFFYYENSDFEKKRYLIDQIVMSHNKNMDGEKDD